MAPAETPKHAGIWRTYFHPSVLLGWNVWWALVCTPLIVAAFLLPYDQFWGANVCFIISAVLIFAKIVEIAVRTQGPTWERVVFTFLFFGIVGVALVEAVHGVNGIAASRRAPAEKETGHKPEPVKPQGEEPKPRTPAAPPALSATSPAPYGNLGERCLALAKDMSDFVDDRKEIRRRNVEDQNLTPNERMERMRTWSESTTMLFRSRLLERAMRLQQELAGFHISDDRMDAILTREQEAIRREHEYPQMPQGTGIHLEDISEMGKRIRLLAEKTRTVPRNPPLALEFSQRELQAETPVLPHKLELVVSVPQVVSMGYIVLEFDRAPGLATIGGDLADENLKVESLNLIPNEQVADLLRRGRGAVLAVKAGKVSFGPERPLRSVIANERPIRLVRVLLCEE